MTIIATDALELKELPDGDIDLDALARGDYASGPKGVALLIDQAIQIVTDEWSLNLDSGIDYFGQIFVTRFDQRRVQAIYRGAIAAVPGVASVVVQATYKRPTITVKWTAQLVFGDAVTGSFSVEVPA